MVILSQDNKHMKGEKKIATGINALVVNEKNGTVFCIKKADTDEYFPGMYALPGGGLHTGESLEEAIQREFTEETGYELKNCSEIKIDVFVDLDTVVFHALIVEGKLGKKITDKVDADIVDAQWVTVEELLGSLAEHHYPESEIQKFRLYLRNKFKK